MKQKLLFTFIIAASTAFVAGLLFLTGLLGSFDRKLSDNLFVIRATDNRIAIIAIDDKSIQEIGRWPWPRSVHAKLLAKLGNSPKAIGFDVTFSESSNKNDDEQLASQLRQFDNVVLPIEAGELRQKGDLVIVGQFLSPNPLFSATRKGLVNLALDSDGIARQTPINLTSSIKLLKNFSVVVLQYFYKDNPKKLQSLLNIPLQNGMMRINFAAAPGSFATYSYVDVLNGKVKPETFQGKIVLIGATASDLHDAQLTPVSSGFPMSGVEIHANVLQTMLEQNYLQVESQEATVLTIVFIALVLSFLFSYLGILKSTLTLIIAAVLEIGYIIISFDHGIIRSIVYPLLTIAALYVFLVMYKYLVESSQKRFIKKALSYYVSRAVMDDILQNPKKLHLGGVRRELTVLFSDIAGFTTISEKLDPEILTRLLNQYLSEMTRLVFENRGVLDKYIGDAVMAFWGAPIEEKQHAYLACKTALAMQQAIDNLKSTWEEVGIDNFTARIGINSGDMIVGNMGSDARFDYTLIGDNVNLGSRLEGLNKEYGTKIIISEATFEHVKHEVVARKIDTVVVKGKARGVGIYELRGIGKPTPIENEFLQQFEMGRKLYEQGKFKNAYNHFMQLNKNYPGDPVIALYITRCKEFVSHPPKAWDGIYHATSK